MSKKSIDPDVFSKIFYCPLGHQVGAIERIKLFPAPWGKCSSLLTDRKLKNCFITVYLILFNSLYIISVSGYFQPPCDIFNVIHRDHYQIDHSIDHMYTNIYSNKIVKNIQYLTKPNQRPMGHITHLWNQYKSMNTFKQSYDLIYYKIGQVVLEKKILKICQCIFTILYLSPLGKVWGPSFEKTWIPFAQGCFVPSLFEIGPVVLEKMKMWKDYDNNDNDHGQRTNFDQKSSLEPLA